jgi:hypothetical protein
MTTLRFRLVERSPPAPLIAQLRTLTQLPISEIRGRAVAGEPIVEVKAFDQHWRDNRTKLVDIARRIEDRTLPLSVSEVFDDGRETPVSPEMLRNVISGFRAIEVQTQCDMMLESGEIESPDQFKPCDEDWSR